MKSLVKAHMAIDERKQVRAKGLAERVRAAELKPVSISIDHITLEKLKSPQGA